MREQAASVARTFVCRLLCLLAMGAFLGGCDRCGEVNTLGSKAEGAGVSEIVVSLKAELEKLREQVQNVE